jgi:hypothetical protein
MTKAQVCTGWTSQACSGTLTNGDRTPPLHPRHRCLCRKDKNLIGSDIDAYAGSNGAYMNPQCCPVPALHVCCVQQASAARKHSRKQYLTTVQSSMQRSLNPLLQLQPHTHTTANCSGNRNSCKLAMQSVLQCSMQYAVQGSAMQVGTTGLICNTARQSLV